ncbi:MAG: hypothetical protein LBH80_04910 [Prevotellaceae bacterium]|jgi:hypothetical protein|nr:hypothetical protein [Prevotellaceae bacterium]
MKKLQLTPFFLLCAVFVEIAASQHETIETRYENGRFITSCVVPIEASEKATSSIMDDFIVQFGSDLPQLFTWAFKGMGLQGEGDELIVYHLKSSEYDEKTKMIHGKMDAIIPKIITFRDIGIDGKMYKKEVSNKRIVVQYDILKATNFIKEAGATFTITRENDTNALCRLDVQVKFGWFFNIFITQKRYRQNLEWRFEQLAKNLKEEAMKRDL